MTNAIGGFYRGLVQNKATSPAILVIVILPDCDYWKHFHSLTAFGLKCRFSDHQIAISRDGANSCRAYHHCHWGNERPMPVDGWICQWAVRQTLLKQAAVGAEHAVFVGTGPLLLTAAQSEPDCCGRSSIPSAQSYASPPWRLSPTMLGTVLARHNSPLHPGVAGGEHFTLVAMTGHSSNTATGSHHRACLSASRCHPEHQPDYGHRS